MVEQLRLASAGVVAIFRRLPTDRVLALVDAVIEGGVRAIEITADSDGEFELIAQVRQRVGADILVGAVTLMTVEHVHAAVHAGADVLLSPHTDEALFTAAQQSGVLLFPGVATPTEVVQAKRAGATILKLFPAASFGVSYLKDLLGPFHGTSFIPTGGVNMANAADFLRVGALAVGIGSSLIPQRLLAEARWQEITKTVAETVAVIRATRAQLENL